MRLEELMIAGFGRFRRRRFTLAPGLNVVYGPNESGKSTLQTFLAGMLYGLKKRGLRREASEEALRYRPWHGGEYRGVLTYRLDSGQTLRVERSFEPGRDDVRLYDAATGEELTARYPQDRRKEPLFAREQLGLDEDAFRSTAWVGQLAVGRMDLGRELVARVGNLQESGREDLSVKAALEALEAQARALGGERAPTRPYGRVLRALAEKRQELERAEALRRQVQDWEAALAEAAAVLAELEPELADTRRRLDWAELREAEARLARERALAAAVRLAPRRDRAAEPPAPRYGLVVAAAALLALAAALGALGRWALSGALAAAGTCLGAFWLWARRPAPQQLVVEADALQVTAPDAAELEALADAVAGLKARCAGAPVDDRRSTSQLAAELRRLEGRRLDLTARVSDLTARVETTVSEGTDTGDLRRELAALEESRAALEFELAALDLAAATLTEVGAEMHREFAPRLHRAMGQAAAALTGGRYREVRVDESAAIRVVTEDERTVGVEELSGGAADQLYLGLRLALLDLVAEGGERVPLLLDDPFVQYDDQRAEAAMEYLARLSRGRQVILLTCHLREAELARHSGVPVHLIDLTDGAAEES